MGEEVKILIRQESQGDALPRTKTQLDDVADSSKRAKDALDKVGGTPPTKPAPSQPAKPATSAQATPTKPIGKPSINIPGGFTAEDLARVDAKYGTGTQDETKSAANLRNRKRVAQAELDLAKARGNGESPETIEQLERRYRARKVAGRFIREQGLSEAEAEEKAGAMIKAQDSARKAAAEEKAAAREKIKAEKDSTKELREQETTSRRMMMRLGGLGATAIGSIGVEELSYFFDRQSIENKDRAARQITGRQIAIESGARGTSTGVQAEAWAADDRAAELEAQTPDIETRAKKKIVNGALKGAGAGAMTGAMTGFSAPVPLPWKIGLAVGGALLGGVAGAWGGKREGDEEKEEHQNEIKRTKDEANSKHALAIKKAREEEIALETDAIRERSKRTLSGFRNAMIDDEARKASVTYRRLLNAGVPQNEAAEVAKLDAQNNWREKEGRIGNALVDARAGAGDIASAARWAQLVMGTWGEVGSKIDRQTSMMQANEAAEHERQTREHWQ